MADVFYDSPCDPFDSDSIPEYYHIQSTEYSGPYADITAPATPNYPVTTPTRYIISVPQVPDITDIGSRPILVYDVNTSVLLTRVTGVPGANEYRLAPATSKRPDIIELHSGQAGHVIGFDYYGQGSVLNGSELNDINVSGSVTAPTLNGNIGSDCTASGYMKIKKGLYYKSNINGGLGTEYKHELIEFWMNGWNMDTNSSFVADTAATTISLNGVNKQPKNLFKVIEIIITDGGGTEYPLYAGGYYVIAPYSAITLYRTAGGIFDNASFNAAIIKIIGFVEPT